MSNARIVYTPRPDATPQGELTALATVYRFILFDCRAGCHANEKAAGVTSANGDDDVRKD